jgi:hypothetical protein
MAGLKVSLPWPAEAGWSQLVDLIQVPPVAVEAPVRWITKPVGVALSFTGGGTFGRRSKIGRATS